MAPNRRFELSETGKRRAFFASLIAGWLSLAGVILLALGLVIFRPHRQADPVAVFNGYIDASAWAGDYLLTWLAGDVSQTAKLATMTAAAAKPDLNSDPVTVLSIRPEADPGVLRTPAAGGNPEVEWAMTLSAVLVAPGAGGASQRRYYRVTFLEAGNAYKALMFPRPINPTSQPVEIQSHYVIPVAADAPLASTVREFMTAFYTTGNSGTMGRYVTAAFAEDPLVKSPYSSVDELSIMAGKDSPELTQAKPGDVVHIMVTAKASMSVSTFNWISAPLRVVLNSAKQWEVDGFDEPIRFGAVNYQ